MFLIRTGNKTVMSPISNVRSLQTRTMYYTQLTANLRAIMLDFSDLSN